MAKFSVEIPDKLVEPIAKRFGYQSKVFKTVNGKPTMVDNPVSFIDYIQTHIVEICKVGVESFTVDQAKEKAVEDLKKDVDYIGIKSVAEEIKL